MSAKWTFTKGQTPTDPANMACSFIPSCVYHQKTSLTLSTSSMIVFPVEQGDGTKKPGHATDLTMVCPDCGYREMFGVAMSADEADWMFRATKGIHNA